MSSMTLSIVIPAYNEGRRLPKTLRAIRGYMDREHGGTGEVIVVDDGSSDDTAALCATLQCEWRILRVIRQTSNRGKGAAVQTGVAQASGDCVLVMDADQSVPIALERRLRDEIMRGADIAVGSRLLPGSQNQRTVLRSVLGLGFARLVHLTFRLPVWDTQCGYKMFSAVAAKQVWSLATEPGYLADIEVLVRAKQLELTVCEIPIAYRDMAGSKLALWRDSWKMLASLWALRRRLKQESIRCHSSGGPQPLGSGHASDTCGRLL